MLSVDKDMYEELGMEGRKSSFSHRKPGKFIVEINLVKPTFTPGKKNYERVKWCLKDRLNLRYVRLLVEF